MRLAIDYDVTATNEALARSGLNFRVNLVGKEEVEYEESPSSGTDLSRLRIRTDGHMDRIHDRRDELGADLVNLMTDNDDVGGIAYVMGSLTHGFEPWAFSIVTWTDSSFFRGIVVAHEIGHNMGLSHDRYVASGNTLTGYSYGYVNARAFDDGAAQDACWRTIMAYGNRCADGGFAQRVTAPYFSNPELRYPDEDGDPLGVAKTSDAGGNDGPADAVLTLEQSHLYVANFRAMRTDDGDIADEATEVAGSSSILADLGRTDVDYFRIELTESGTLQVGTTGDVDTVGALEDDSGEELASDDDGGPGFNFLITLRLDAGTYFVRVESCAAFASCPRSSTGQIEGSSGAYALVVYFHAASDDDDHGDMPESATEVAPTSTTEVRFDGEWDSDYLRFTLPERGALRIESSGDADTTGVLTRTGDPFRFYFRNELAQTDVLADDDDGPGGNFKIAGKMDADDYTLLVRTWDGSAGETTVNIAFEGGADDHADARQDATPLTPPTRLMAALEAPLDLDFFRIDLAERGCLALGTEGSTDTWGTLRDATGEVRAQNDDDAGNWPNFGLAAKLDPGRYFLEVTGWFFSEGPYTLAASLDSLAAGDSTGTAIIPLFIADGHDTQQGFARIVNRTACDGEVAIAAIDDAGQRHGPVALTIGGGQTRHFNSADLESGNAAKGLAAGVGDGEGNWRLELTTDLSIEALAYVRTVDGFLTSMHDVVRADDEGRHRVVIFNPGSNRTKESQLRLTNPASSFSPDAAPAEVTIRGVDDAGKRSGEVTLTLPVGESRTLVSSALEEGGDGFEGSLGNGEGKWELTVSADEPIRVMNLLEATDSGTLTNLSSAPIGNSVPLFMPAAHPGQQGFLRVVNRSDEEVSVNIDAVDDGGLRPDRITLAIGAGSVRHFNSDDLEGGNAAKGLSGSVGAPAEGNWRLTLSGADAIDVYSYVRTTDGFLTSMHDVAEVVGGRHLVPIFNPGSNLTKASRLRIVNPGDADAEVTIEAVDDAGSEGDSAITLTVPAGNASEISAAEMETGGEGFEGKLGDGSGKWRLTVSANQTIRVMSLLEATNTGNLTNLSLGGAAVGGG